MSCSKFRQRERSVDHRPQATGEDVAQNLMQFRHCAHIRTKQGKLAGEEVAQIESYRRPGRRTAGYQLASTLERSQTLIPRRQADVFDYDVDTFFVRDLADLFGNLLLVMIDAVISPECASLFRVWLRRRRW